MRKPCSSGTPGWFWSGWTATRRPCAWPGSGWPGTPTGPGWCTPGTTSCRGCSTSWGTGRSTGCCSTSASPRCSWTSRRAGSPTRGTPRWTCGWTRPGGAPRRRWSTPTTRRAWPGSCGGTARSASPGRSPRRSSGSGRARRSPRPRGWRSWSSGRSRRRPGVPAATRPSARSRRCASRSTASSTRCPPGYRRRWTGWPSVGGRWCCRTTRWRTGSSSEPWRNGHAVRHRRTCRWSHRVPDPGFGC